MFKKVIKFLSIFIPVKKLRKRFVARTNIKYVLKLAAKKNTIQIDPNCLDILSLNLVGENNSIIIKTGTVGNGHININVAADNSIILIDEDVTISDTLNIVIGQLHPNFGKVTNVKLHIGKNTSFESTFITTFNSNSVIKIGENCMFSTNIRILNTDGHPIYDAGDRKILNRVNNLIIGNHVWVGSNVAVLKNVNIPDDSIVGLGSIVTKSYWENGVVISGNPAKVVKKGIFWDSNGSQGYIQNK